MMTKLSVRALTWLMIALVTAPPGAIGQQSGAAPVSKQEELDQLLAPIALYPDSLVSQILMASTYPLEVVHADRFAKQNKNLKGDALAKALEKQSWDPSVKSLVNFPQVLTMMSEKLDWTQKLGDAFLAQQKQVLATIQSLRAKAVAAGNAKNHDRAKSYCGRKNHQDRTCQPAGGLHACVQSHGSVRPVVVSSLSSLLLLSSRVCRGTRALVCYRCRARRGATPGDRPIGAAGT